MKQVTYICLVLVVYWGFCPRSIYAQSQTESLRIGLGMSGIRYTGDLTDNQTAYHRVYPGGNISLQFAGKATIQAQLNAGFGKFMEQFDATIPPPSPGVRMPTFVETSFFYTDMRIRVRFFKRKNFSPYLTGGAGIMTFSPKDENGKLLGDALITRLSGEEYNTAIFYNPVGAGFFLRVNPIISLGFEYIYRNTPTDYLDNIGQLGGREGKDYVESITASLYFTLNPKEEWRTPIEPPVDTTFDKNREPFFVGILSQLQTLAENPVENDWMKPVLVLASLIHETPLISPTNNTKRTAVPIPEKIKETFTPMSLGADLKPIDLDVEPPSFRVGIEKGILDSYPLQDTINWVIREDQAIYDGRFIYYRVKRSDDLTTISKKFKTRIPTILQLNFMKDERIYEGIHLRLPNLGIPADDQE